MHLLKQNMTSRFSSGESSVYGVVLNDRASLDALGDQLEQAPYKQAPNAPILYIKPRNTVVEGGAEIELPTGETEVEIGATIGLVAERTMTRVKPEDALSYLAGGLLVADLSLPHDSYYRPAIREKCFDGACPVGGKLIPVSELESGIKRISISVNGNQIAEREQDQQIRSFAQLLADVTEFMTLRPGDMLLVGVQYQAPRASKGDKVELTIGDTAGLAFTLSANGGVQ